CAELIAALRGRVGEPCSDLVFPSLFEPMRRERRFEEGLKDGRPTAHVGRAAEHDAITPVELNHQRVVREAPLLNLPPPDLEYVPTDLFDAADAFKNRLRQHFRVPCSRLKDNC